MKVGTDGVLLGAWAPVETATEILDVGTGSGLIALMAAQRNRYAGINAIDIDPDAVAQAADNFRQSPWSERVSVHLSSLQDFAKVCTTRFDAIISNPPFFARSLKSPDEKRTTARHTDTLDGEELLSISTGLLAPDGKIHLILPYETGKELVKKAVSWHLYCGGYTEVLPAPDAPAKRLLLSFGRQPMAFSASRLIIETGQRHHYSEEYIRLTKEFYLNF
jgi:tRNA1Val (adenine37-N6)-methyltransferase